MFGSELLGRAAVSVRPLPLLEVGGDLAAALSGSDAASVPVEVLPWARLHGGSAAALTAGAGFGLGAGLGAPDYRVFAGLTLAPDLDRKARDRDADGLSNASDFCPSDAEDPDGATDGNGCPDEDDDDGITDLQDACRAEAEDFDGTEDFDGCPERDDDRDGVVDTADCCVDVPEDRDRFQDLDGCPEPDNDSDGFLDGVDPCPLAADEAGCPPDWNDRDTDGHPDADDRCPSEPEDVDRWRDDDGCPDPDNDEDGIPDLSDACPAEPENPNGILDTDGCVDAAPERVRIEAREIVVREPIAFEAGGAVLDETSYPVLGELAAVLASHSELVRIQVEGHTDDTGSAAANLKLSRARAEAVVAYLIRAGVDPGRLVAKGFGESLPIDTNDTARGKAQNRRVEFTILEQR